jgi:hypothetical protein
MRAPIAGALVDEGPDVALGVGQRKRVCQGGHGAVLVAEVGQRQRSQCLDLDDAARPVLGTGCGP